MQYFSTPNLKKKRTSVAVDAPCWWLGRIWQAHIILGIDPEMVLDAGEDVVGVVRVSAEAVCHCLPHSGVGVTLRHHVVKPVVQLLVWRGSPCYQHSPLDCLLQLNWPRRLGFIYQQLWIWKEIICHFSLCYWSDFHQFLHKKLLWNLRNPLQVHSTTLQAFGRLSSAFAALCLSYHVTACMNQNALNLVWKYIGLYYPMHVVQCW